MGKGSKKSKKKGKEKGKVTADPDRKRLSHKIEIKQLAIELKDQTKRNQEIIDEIRKRYKIKLPTSTV